MTRELYIDNQRVDLPDDVRFQLTFQIADFGELRPRGSGSNTIRLPKTPRNTAIFNNCNFVQVDSDFPYVLHSAYYYEDGWLVFNDATVYMLAITDTDFEIQCTWGNAPEIQRLKALDMGDVNGLGNVNYDAEAYPGVETGIREYQGEIQRFPLSVKNGNVYSPYTRGVMPLVKALAAAGIGTDGMSDAIKAYIDGLYVFPAVKSAKKKYEDVVFNYPKTTTILDPRGEPEGNGMYNGGLYGWNYGSGEEIQYSSSRRKSFFFEPTQNGYASRRYDYSYGLTPQMSPGKWYDVTLEVTVYDVSLDKRAEGASVLDRSKFNIAAVLGQAMGQLDDPAFSTSTKENSGVPSDNDSTLVLTGSLPSETVGHPAVVLTGSKRLYINDTAVTIFDERDKTGVQPVYLAIYPFTYNQEQKKIAACAQVTAEATLTVSAVGGYIDEDIHMPEETGDTREHMTVGFRDVLRGVSAYDFVTQALINAGALFDHKDGKTRVYTYDDIANNGAQMIDWSDKLVYIKEESTFNQSGGSRNWVKYKASEYYNGFGDGYYTDPLAEKLKKEDKTVIENRTFGFVNDNGLPLTILNPAYLPFVLRKTKDTGGYEYEIKESGLHLVRLESSSGVLVNGAGRRVYGTHTVLKSSDKQPTFDNIKATHWARYIAMQQQYRKAKAVFMLNGQDIAELDFRRPIYLRQYAQAYVLTKVNYQPAATTVEMLLIR